MTYFRFSRSLDELIFEEASFRGLTAIGPPLIVEGNSLCASVSASVYEVEDKDIPKEAIAFVPSDRGYDGGNYAVIAMQFYKKP